MKILFIRPGMLGNTSKDAMMPLVFAIIKPLTPADFDIEFYDERVEWLPESTDADLVAMTVETFSARRAYHLALTYRRQGIPVIMGGFHPTMLPDESLRYCESVIVGEAEDTWPLVMEDLRAGNLKPRYESSGKVDLSGIVYDYSVFRNKKYNKIGLLQFSRGCKFSCDFCSVHAFFKEPVRCKPIPVIVNELKAMKERYIFFIDDNLFSDEQAAKALFEALVPLKKKWVCQISIDVAKNRELLHLMKKSGCMVVLIGFESLNVENLKQMGKGANVKYNDYDEIIGNIYDAGIMIYGTFVVGYDYDTAQSTRELVEFALHHQFAIANFNPLMPMPGTRLHKRLLEEGHLSYEDWWINEEYRYGDAMLTPKSMTGEELKESCKHARYTFNSYKNIFKRLLHPKANAANLEYIAIFLLANLISRFEIRAKQGKKLGGYNCDIDLD